MLAARIYRKSDKTMLILPIPLPVTAERIEASIRRRIDKLDNLEFVDVVELPDEMAEAVHHHMHHHDHDHTVEVEIPEPTGEPGVPWPYYIGTMAMLAVMFMILRHARREGQ
jgi:hypothetical protein